MDSAPRVITSELRIDVGPLVAANKLLENMTLLPYKLVMPIAAAVKSPFDVRDIKFSDKNVMLFEAPCMFKGEKSIKLCAPEIEVIPPDAISRYELPFVSPSPLSLGRPALRKKELGESIEIVSSLETSTRRFDLK